MAEVMMVESIVEAEWLLNKGYWTKLRFPFQTGNGGWSDIDILSYCPATKHLVISESKVRGKKDLVMAYTADSRSRYGTILEYDAGNYFSFLDHLPRLCEDHVIFEDFARSVARLTIQLVSNYVIDRSLLEEATQTVVARATDLVPIQGIDVDVMLDTTLDVMARVIELERAREQGRRYGHPMLDIAREFNRYLHPRVSYAGRGKSKIEAVRKQGLQRFWCAIDGPGIAALLSEDP